MKIIVNRITPPSRPARGGWIEIPFLPAEWIAIVVPPRTGRVD